MEVQNGRLVITSWVTPTQAFFQSCYDSAIALYNAEQYHLSTPKFQGIVTDPSAPPKILALSHMRLSLSPEMTMQEMVYHVEMAMRSWERQLEENPEDGGLREYFEVTRDAFLHLTEDGGDEDTGGRGSGSRQDTRGG